MVHHWEKKDAPPIAVGTTHVHALIGGYGIMDDKQKACSVRTGLLCLLTFGDRLSLREKIGVDGSVFLKGHSQKNRPSFPGE